MINKKVALAGRPGVKIYCVETKTLLYTCKTVKQAEVITGVKSWSIHKYISVKSRCHKNKLGKILAFRYA